MLSKLYLNPSTYKTFLIRTKADIPIDPIHVSYPFSTPLKGHLATFMFLEVKKFRLCTRHMS